MNYELDHTSHRQKVLKLDIAGIPEKWITQKKAAKMIAEGHMAWSLGEVLDVFHGGYSHNGVRSTIEVPSIVATRGTAGIYLPDIPVSVTREKIFIRDRNMCAYCGEVFHPDYLEAEHIMPKSRNGAWSWMNLVASCKNCNQHIKKNQTPMEAGMSLLYLPYIPNYWEGVIMEGRNVLADQMEFLLASVPRYSRLLNN